MSSTQTLSPGGEPQLGRSRFSSPLMGVLVVAHEGRHPMNMLPPPMVALPLRVAPGTTITLLILAENGYSRGRYPVSKFPSMLKTRKLLRSLTHNGNSPDSRLFARFNVTRVETSPSSDGIGPESLLLARFSTERLVRFPSSFGIGPESLVLKIDSCVRLVRVPNSGGRVPFSGLPPMMIVPTRCGVPDRFIPPQLVIAVDAFQLRVAVPRRVSFRPQRTLQSAMRPVFV